ncbi:unnamed protein product, partial [Nesidiocoris tenuis]
MEGFERIPRPPSNPECPQTTNAGLFPNDVVAQSRDRYQPSANAIHALQELSATSSAATRYPYPLPAHSNPNLPYSNHGVSTEILRSNSQPPEIWRGHHDHLYKLADAQTQTEPALDII